MRWLYYVVVITALLPGCRKDFHLTTDFKEIPVVFGMLDLQDSVHFVRVQRAFIDADGSALLWSQVSDSIYYRDVLDVYVEELESQELFLLERVDGDSIGIPKPPGGFAHAPNILYRFSAHLDGAASYRLYIYNRELNQQVTASSSIVNDFFSIVPSTGYVINWSGSDDDKVNFSWQNAANAQVYELIIRFNYTETTADPADTTIRTVRWSAFTNHFAASTAPGVIQERLYPSKAFYSYIGSQVGPANGSVRVPLDVDFELWAGGEALANYVNNHIATSGITETVVTPGYTNVNGGIGVFSSRFVKRFDSITLGQTALDSLVNGQFTKHIGFSL